MRTFLWVHMLTMATLWAFLPPRQPTMSDLVGMMCYCAAVVIFAAGIEKKESE